MSTMSILSAVNAVIIVNAVKMPSKTRPPSGGLARVAHDVTIAPIPSDDFGEIIDNGSAGGGRPVLAIPRKNPA
ncbi:MAG: hypothetical protein RL069_2484 [Planctomycetota bacterium]|jgi:hypothetical protein